MTPKNKVTIDNLMLRIGRLNRRQILVWQSMSPVDRLDLAFQAYQFALETVRLTEGQRASDLSESQFNWRVTRRMQGNQKLGREVSVG